MKKYLKYFILFVVIIFVIPVLCTRGASTTIATTEEDNTTGENSENNENNNENNAGNNDVDNDKSASNYDYKDYSTIKLYHTKTEEIEEISLDEYIYGTVAAEMPANYDIEALKAQAVASRTYTIYQIMNGSNKHGEASICDDSSCCQAWISKEDRLAKWSEEEREGNWNKIVEAVNSTSGKIITYDGKPIDALFHSNSGGKTETVSNVWGGDDKPYLQSVETSGETEYTQYSSEVSLTKNELLEKVKKDYPNIEIDFDSKDENGNSNAIKILDYTESGRVKTLKIGSEEIAGTKARSLFGLKSTNFSVTFEGDNIIFSVIGYGHGVGMSQTGADSMAKSGSNYEEIISHFYSGVKIEDF